MDQTQDSSSMLNLSKITARLVALKMLYANEFMESTNTPPSPDEHTRSLQVNEIYADMLEEDNSIAEPNQDFLALLYATTKNNLDVIDANISQNLRQPWTLARLDPVVRSIMRLAVGELLFFGDMPPKVIIDQYVSLTGDFYAKEEVGFVNALLDLLAKKIRKEKSNPSENSE